MSLSYEHLNSYVDYCADCGRLTLYLLNINAAQQDVRVKRKLHCSHNGYFRLTKPYVENVPILKDPTPNRSWSRPIYRVFYD
jgi:hypothetical protein